MSQRTSGGELIADFAFATASQVLFGAGRAARLPEVVAPYGDRIFLCTGRDPDRHAGLLGGLEPAGRYAVGGEPTIGDVQTALAAARAAGPDVLVAIGGGSAIDLAKAVGILLAAGGGPLDYLEVVGAGAPLTGPSVPVVAVPTTAGTGAEVTANAVLSSPEHGVKASLRSPSMLPRVALVDPDLTLDCPPSVTAAGGLDAFTQCLEPLVSPQANPVTDALALTGLRRAGSADGSGLRAAFADGSNRVARADMALCSVLGGMALANAKLGAVHGFAGVLGGRVQAAHGAICAALLAGVVEVNLAALADRDPGNPAHNGYRAAAVAVTGSPTATGSDLVTWITETIRLLGIPGLSAIGVDGADRAEIVAKAKVASSMKGNPLLLTDDELTEILARSA